MWLQGSAGIQLALLLIHDPAFLSLQCFSDWRGDASMSGSVESEQPSGTTGVWPARGMVGNKPFNAWEAATGANLPMTN